MVRQTTIPILSTLAGAVPLKLFLGLLNVFAYSFMIISYLSICLIYYIRTLHFSVIQTQRVCLLFCLWDFYDHPSPLLNISASIWDTLSSFKNYLSENTKNKTFCHCHCFTVLLLLSGEVEINPGPHISRKNNLSFGVWNLDSLPARDVARDFARDFARIPLIAALQTTYYISYDDISINRFSPDPFRSDKVSTIRNGGVCLYYKESLPVTKRCDLERLPETIVVEIKLNRKKYLLFRRIVTQTCQIMILPNIWNCWKISMNPCGKKILPCLFYAETLMLGLHCFGKVTLKIMRDVYLISFWFQTTLNNLLENPLMCVTTALNLVFI